MPGSKVTLKGFNLPELGKCQRGKVRDSYSLGNGTRLIVTTDRQSAFDRVLAEIPYKGAVLNQLSAFWFEQTKDIIPNHLIEVIDPHAVIVKDMTPFRVEVVVRGYLSGVTTTSAWYAYERGEREFCGNTMPDGMKKNQAFPTPLITPTTKSDTGHDMRISPKEVVEQGLVPAKQWKIIADAALNIFARGQEIARKSGLILVDTKYEFGEDQDGNVFLIDEVHTPDSSRYWIATNYEERFKNSEEPDYLDKEFLRIWLKQQGFMGDGPMPEIPEEFINRMADVYISTYEKLTGKQIERTTVSPRDRLINTLRERGIVKGALVEVMLGSDSDKDFCAKMLSELEHWPVAVNLFVGSAHKNTLKVFDHIRELNAADEPVVFITVAGRSNALSGVVAANSIHPVIACPPHKDKDDYLVNIHSSLQMPSQTPVMTVCDPVNAALAAVRMIGFTNPAIVEKNRQELANRT